MNSRREKIEALLSSDQEGERAAAEAALARVTERIPPKGSPEYLARIRAWCGDIDWAVSKLGTPGLTPAEIRIIRNVAKYRGTPWGRGSDSFRAVFDKLQELQKREAKALIPIVYTESMR